MATCKDCFHYNVCDYVQILGNDMENECKEFKNKSDFQKVKHGEWVECFEDWRKQIAGDECSHCGFQYYGSSINHYHYCPNCGAKMDKEMNKNE